MQIAPFHLGCCQWKFSRHRETDPNPSTFTGWKVYVLQWTNSGIGTHGSHDGAPSFFCYRSNTIGGPLYVRLCSICISSLYLFSSFLSQWLAHTTNYPTTTLVTHLSCFVTDLPFSIAFTTVDHSLKACKLVWLRSVPIAVQVAVVLFEQVIYHNKIPEDIITKSPVRCTTGSTPLHTSAPNFIASQANHHRVGIPVCQPFEGAVDRGALSSPV